MKIIRWLCLVLMYVAVLPATGDAQLWNTRAALTGMSDTRAGMLRAGIGWTRIAVNDTGAAINYATLTLNPELSIGKLHGGLTIDVLINTTDDPGGSRIKQSDLKPGSLIRYIRYGQSDDPLFFHVGALDRVTLGHGFILSRYSNQVSDRSRRVGAWFKVFRGRGGVEALVSNIGAREIYGVRAFIRPITQQGLLNDLTVGATIVIDDDPNRGRTRFASHSAEVVGLDMELPLIKKSYFSFISYGDFAKILDSGSGGALGLRLQIPSFLRILSLTGRLEQHFLGDGFIPAFFDETYEVTSVLASGQTRTEQLQGIPASSGTLTAIEGIILNRLRVWASYRSYYGRNASGVFHAEAHLLKVIPRITMRAIYDKQGINSFSDIRTLDDRSVAIAEATYRVNRFLLIGVDYRWTFAFDDNPNIQTYRPIERFSPKILFEYGF